MMRSKMENFLAGGIYGLTAAEYSLGRSNTEVVDLLIAAGIKVIQYREKYKKAGAMFEECRYIRERTRLAGVTFIVNDFVDLALAAGADGVHLGQEDLPPQEVRKLVGNDMLIGLSTHSPEQADAAAKLDIDYIGVGPIFPTQTKNDVCAAVGFAYLDYVVHQSKLPFVAIGGIKEDNVLSVSQRGACMIAMVTEIVGAADIVSKVAQIRRNIVRG